MRCASSNSIFIWEKVPFVLPTNLSSVFILFPYLSEVLGTFPQAHFTLISCSIKVQIGSCRFSFNKTCVFNLSHLKITVFVKLQTCDLTGILLCRCRA